MTRKLVQNNLSQASHSDNPSTGSDKQHPQAINPMHPPSAPNLQASSQATHPSHPHSPGRTSSNAPPPPAWATLLNTPNAHPFSTHLRHHVIPAAHGFAFSVRAGTHFRIIDLHGLQVVDFMSWALPFSTSTSCEHFSASYTRYNIKGSAPPVEGEYLYSNHDRKMFEVVRDVVKCHDLLYMACNPGFYRRAGMPKHRNCATNMAEAINEWRKSEEAVVVDGNAEGEFKWYQVHDPFNIFQNTPYYTLKALENSRPGDYIELKAEMDTVVALSCCPYESDGFNGGKVTDVAVVWEE